MSTPPISAEEITLQLAQVLPLFESMSDALLRIGKLEGQFETGGKELQVIIDDVKRIDIMLRGERGDNGLFSKFKAIEHKFTALQNKVVEGQARQLKWTQGIGIPLILLLFGNIIKEFMK